MSKLSLVIPTVGEKNTIAEPKVDTAFSTVQTWANGEIEGTNNLASEGVVEANLSSAVKTLLNTKSAFALSLVKKNETPFAIATGELVVMEKAASEVKLPAATLNRIVGVWCATTSITIKAVAVKTIFGDFLAEAGETTITLTKGQHVVLQADGTNWLIIAGEPKREQAYSALTSRAIETEFEANANRPTLVSLQGEATEGGGREASMTVTVGGVVVGIQRGTAVAPASGIVSYSFICPPGIKWKANVTANSGGVALKSTYLTL